jgi:large subunit ribosomal protein L24
MKVKKGDKVIVIAGKEKGKTSIIVRVLPAQNKVILEGLNMVKKSMKAKKAGEKGQVVSIAMPINASNVKLADKVHKEIKGELKSIVKKVRKNK